VLLECVKEAYGVGLAHVGGQLVRREPRELAGLGGRRGLAGDDLAAEDEGDDARRFPATVVRAADGEEAASVVQDGGGDAD
jgi:hypothetical protein